MSKNIFTKFLAKAVLLAGGALIALPSCIAENLDDCPTDILDNMQLIIKTDWEVAHPELAPETRADYQWLEHPMDWYENQIDGITVLVFDENDNLVIATEEPAYTMWEEYLVPLTLPKGHTYKIVAWSNTVTGAYAISPADRISSSDIVTDPVTMDEVSMDMVLPSDRTLTSNIPHRHHGELITSVFDDTSYSSQVLVIKPHTYKVNFDVQGLTTNLEEFGIRVADYNSKHKQSTYLYGFPEVITDAEPYFHTRDLNVTVPSTGSEMSRMSASMTLLQIGDYTGDKVTSIEIVNLTTDEVIYPVNDEQEDQLLRMIEKAYKIASQEAMMDLLGKEYEYTIAFTFGSDLSVTIEINGWTITDQEIEL